MFALMSSQKGDAAGAAQVLLLSSALGFYRERLGSLLLDKPQLGYAAGFYLLYAAGIVALAVNPALDGGNWVNALIAGAILGLSAYGTYDMTNLSTLRGWFAHRQPRRRGVGHAADRHSGDRRLSDHEVAVPLDLVVDIDVAPAMVRASGGRLSPFRGPVPPAPAPQGR